MYIHDISRDTLTTETYPGDPETVVTPLRSIDEDDECNLSQISMCVHAGTHIDAPLHFCPDGKGITDLRLNTFYGKCTVITVKGVLTGEDMDKLLPYCRKRILFRGNGKTYLSHSAAIVLAQSRVVLVGTDAESIAPPFDEVKTSNFGRNVKVMFCIFHERVCVFGNTATASISSPVSTPLTVITVHFP